ncbi:MULTISPECIES: acylphosphatase [unclassified Mesorhizobium]|uniref:acylphosphatase n=1 Tax=unclassified Mesorhizobium TaxID=325217 RepID=UPI000FDC8303|nr:MULTISPECIES: acylphosphatase [unclassified Mesorhizobium]TGQ33915.1 acylphosphatase [Mesorhizobium sp. M00.F.Ca.ET.216.01.1.1]TIS57334.1 MAG: acylphosphatase [Mesorhizobium sp.]TIS91651.1 MAG: acylphosphatase [Mesorhizobium sp.]TJW10073.1 MAG: acylphosphatase [Mesorhizobium sp.]TJW41009.1 MAG: acylphosphatase [Mesorhizobium sp.]
MEDARKAIRVNITGRVQGVSFRIWTQTEAEKLGLAGWVRNEDDGSVTALIVGAGSAVSTMMTRLWKGPIGASVASVTSQDIDPGQKPDGFRIIG